jgi:hypothetical protein
MPTRSLNSNQVTSHSLALQPVSGEHIDSGYWFGKFYFDPDRLANAGELQNAIWFLEDEGG